jgi:hypothetical protein
MYIYNPKPLGFPSRSTEQLITSRRGQRSSDNAERVVSEFLGRGGINSRDIWALEGLGQLTTDDLSKKLKHLSFLPHFVESNGKDVWLKPSVMDPGIYAGPENYVKSGLLQGCLERVFKDNKKFRHIKVALVDLTKDVMQPEFAGSFDHKLPVMAASIPKIAAMLAAHQLLQDLRVAVKKQHKGAKDLNELFKLVRQDWGDTQHDHGGKAEPFTRGVSLRGKLVLVNGNKIPLHEPKAPRLEHVVEGAPKAIKFRSTGQSKAQLETIIDEFTQAFEDLDTARKTLNEEEKKGNAIRVAEARRKHKERLRQFDQEKAKLNALGFLERMRVMIGGLIPASNYATSTIVRDVGFLYIASTLLQSGLYDTNRNGGLWLGGDYWSTSWKGPLGGEKSLVTATAGSLAAFMTLLMQNKLVSPAASFRMRSLMQIEPLNLTHPTTISMFEQGLSPFGPMKRVLVKIGSEKKGPASRILHECAYIEHEVKDMKDGKKTLRYVAVGLGAKSADELRELILQLYSCISSNNYP